MNKFLSIIFFSLIFNSALAQRTTDTFKLYFDLNVSALDKNIEKKIDLLIYNDKIINGSNIMIIGYADYLGSEGYNKNLSIQRAKNIKSYLVKYGINAPDIKVCVGEGEVERRGLKDKTGFPTDRRVDIVINNKKKKKAETPKPKVAAAKPPKDTVKKMTANIDEITRLQAGSTILLKNVYFPANRHILEPESYATLEKLYTILKDNPGIKISIEGHVCCISPEAPDAIDADWDSPTLSVNRARAIYDYLVNKGIDPGRLQYKGFGKRRPIIADEKTEADKEKNRRVEIRIVENAETN